MTNTQKKHIVFISDDNYAMPTIVAATSLYANKNESTCYTVHILCSSVSESNLKAMKRLSRPDFDVDVRIMNDILKYEDLDIETLHVSSAALYKFDIANIFSDLDKILYLDGDILVQKDLSDLFEADISSYYAAVVKDYKPMTYDPPQTERLGIPKHTAYFNSGVMLMNLCKLRNDNIYDKLINYRKTGVNFFMDQDALNVVFREQVLYLPLQYNVMSSVMGHFSGKLLKKYYGLNTSDKEKIYGDASIVHLCTKYKPWDYSNVPFADEWYAHYLTSPIDGTLARKTLSSKDAETFSRIDLKNAKISKHSDPELIVSLTSFPARIKTVHLTVESLLCQSKKADMVILWLAKNQFPQREEQLPPQLMALTSKGLTIYWCDDLRPHKKYYHTMLKYPESIVITVDDDVVYGNDLIETLYASYKLFPYAVSCMRGHEITFNGDGTIKPYSDWVYQSKRIYQPSMDLIATGVGGVLYPPHCLSKEVFNLESIQNLCLNADDLWLKTMEALNMTPTVISGVPTKVQNIKGTQEEALWKSNKDNCENDMQFSRIIDVYNNWHGETDTLLSRLKLSWEEGRSAEATSSVETERLKLRLKMIETEKKLLSEEITAIRSSTSYKIGQVITFIPRKFIGGIKCLKENGFKYTVNRALQKLHIK